MGDGIKVGIVRWLLHAVPSLLANVSDTTLRQNLG